MASNPGSAGRRASRGIRGRGPLDPVARAAGLHVFRASRLEGLLEPLDFLLHAAPPADVLEPQTILAAHPGIRHWLVGALARLRGRDGIVANLEIELAGSWLNRLAREVGVEAVVDEGWRPARLRWHLHGLLGTLPDPRLAAYLADDPAGRRRFQLAGRLAEVFTQYLVYRGDWLDDWERGGSTHASTSFQPELWRALREQLPGPHRASLLRDILRRLLDPPRTLPSHPLHVFGHGHLPPRELDLLAALALHRPVMLYVPDPCAELWDELPDRATLVSAAASAPFEPPSEGRFLAEVQHPLLAAWGRMGQHFQLALNRLDVAMDVRHWEDEPTALHAPMPLLARVQESIRRFAPALAREVPATDAIADCSLRVHLCHTRLRELEVLRDCLLEARRADPSLQPFHIAVMAPDITAYVPLLPAVFGAPGQPGGALPYHLSDVPLARTHPLLSAFARLLQLPGSRTDVAEIADLLQLPAVAARLGLDAGGLEAVLGWLQASRVAWGLDGAHRARFGVPAIEEYTFAWAMDRLLAGVVFGQEGEGHSVPLPDAGTEGEAIWPVAGVGGPQAEALGALHALLCELARLEQLASAPRRASAWSRELERLLDALFRVDPTDRAAREALAILRGLVRGLTLESGAAGDPLLAFGVVRDALAERLDAVPERQPFLMGGMTVCGMVPQRSIPFRMIAVLGLNDGEFPRVAADTGLNLMKQPGGRRLGDRDTRSEDRYLFLETLMSARDRLHLSYIGEGVRDGKPRNPAAPLAELLAFLDAQLAPDKDTIEARKADGCSEEEARRPWLLRHPLQPFDARYFGHDSRRLFSFDAAMAAPPGTPPPPFLSTLAAGPVATAPRDRATPHAHATFTARAAPGCDRTTTASPRTLPLRTLLHWFRRPAEALLTREAQLSLEALENDAPGGDEPLDDRLDRIERVGRRLVLDALLSGTELPAHPPDWLRLTGLLPAGRMGMRAWHREYTEASALLQDACTRPPFRDGPVQRTPQSISWQCGDVRIEGELQDVFAQGGALWLLDVRPGRKNEQLGFDVRVPLFLQWALLRLSAPDGVDVRACLLHGDMDAAGDWMPSIAHWCDAFAQAVAAGDAATVESMRDDLAARVAALAGCHASAATQPPAYYPRTSWAVLTRPQDTVKVWEGTRQHPGERDYAPGYTALLAGELSLEEGAALDAVLAFAHRLLRLIDLTADHHGDQLADPANARVAEPEASHGR